ncbi:hypothetical protein ENBRE01_0637 [Enteropsectra breve]|nr:hypothetical protein ENBRE01_0637 [Enteropsectra breve]
MITTCSAKLSTATYKVHATLRYFCIYDGAIFTTFFYSCIEKLWIIVVNNGEVSVAGHRISSYQVLSETTKIMYHTMQLKFTPRNEGKGLSQLLIERFLTSHENKVKHCELRCMVPDEDSYDLAYQCLGRNRLFLRTDDGWSLNYEIYTDYLDKKTNPVISSILHEMKCLSVVAGTPKAINLKNIGFDNSFVSSDAHGCRPKSTGSMQRNPLIDCSYISGYDGSISSSSMDGEYMYAEGRKQQDMQMKNMQDNHLYGKKCAACSLQTARHETKRNICRGRVQRTDNEFYNSQRAHNSRQPMKNFDYHTSHSPLITTSSGYNQPNSFSTEDSDGLCHGNHNLHLKDRSNLYRNSFQADHFYEHQADHIRKSTPYESEDSECSSYYPPYNGAHGYPNKIYECDSSSTRRQPYNASRCSSADNKHRDYRREGREQIEDVYGATKNCPCCSSYSNMDSNEMLNSSEVNNFDIDTHSELTQTNFIQENNCNAHTGQQKRERPWMSPQKGGHGIIFQSRREGSHNAEWKQHKKIEKVPDYRNAGYFYDECTSKSNLEKKKLHSKIYSGPMKMDKAQDDEDSSEEKEYALPKEKLMRGGHEREMQSKRHVVERTGDYKLFLENDKYLSDENGYYSSCESPLPGERPVIYFPESETSSQECDAFGEELSKEVVGKRKSSEYEENPKKCRHELGFGKTPVVHELKEIKPSQYYRLPTEYLCENSGQGISTHSPKPRSQSIVIDDDFGMDLAMNDNRMQTSPNKKNSKSQSKKDRTDAFNAHW